MDEAVEWVKRCPNPMEGDSEIEIRRVFEAEDFGEQLTPELREQEERLRERAEPRRLRDRWRDGRRPTGRSRPSGGSSPPG